MKKILFVLCLVSVGCKKYKNYDSLTDVDGNIYETVSIRNGQKWMAENLIKGFRELLSKNSQLFSFVSITYSKDIYSLRILFK